MSEIVEQDKGRVVVRNYFDELCYVIQSLNCERHGDTTHITDSTGSDRCIKCLESIVGSHAKLEESL